MILTALIIGGKLRHFWVEFAARQFPKERRIHFRMVTIMRKKRFHFPKSCSRACPSCHWAQWSMMGSSPMGRCWEQPSHLAGWLSDVELAIIGVYLKSNQDALCSITAWWLHCDSSKRSHCGRAQSGMRFVRWTEVPPGVANPFHDGYDHFQFRLSIPKSTSRVWASSSWAQWSLMDLLRLGIG